MKGLKLPGARYDKFFNPLLYCLIILKTTGPNIPDLISPLYMVGIEV